MNWVFYICLLVPCCELLRAQGDLPLVNTTDQTTTREATTELPTTDKVIASTYASTEQKYTTEPISKPSTTEQITGVTTDPSNDQTSTDEATTQLSTTGEDSETTTTDASNEETSTTETISELTTVERVTVSTDTSTDETPTAKTTNKLSTDDDQAPATATTDPSIEQTSTDGGNGVESSTAMTPSSPNGDNGSPNNSYIDVVVYSVLGTLLGVTVTALIVHVVWTRVKQRRHTPDDEAVQPPDEIELTVIGVRMGPEGVDSRVYADKGLPEWASKWEILWSNLAVEEQVLGRGNFGEVKKGTVKVGGKVIQSAIKMLKGQASDRDQKDFMDEFRTMSIIGYHQNVVSLLGACQHHDVLYVALEFLPNGDLHSYLTGLVNSNTAHILTSTKLVKFALDVARGMKHLSDLGVIHRDLAARNILLGEALIAKVSDFGLSREQNIYVQTSTRCVPARWLAIESLKHKTYTTQSDVWSFGIFLWEIATLGGVPYPDIMSRALAGKLEEGYRMPKPGNCHRDIYSLMRLCWDEDPNKRPTFTHLVSHLSKMDANKIRHTYMQVDRTHYESVMRLDIDDN